MAKTKKKCRCSPYIDGKRIKNSCFTDKQMMTVKHKLSIKETNPTKIYTAIKSKLGCNTDCCVASKVTLLKQSLAPEMPKSWMKNSREWLSNWDISNVLKGYEKRYKCFFFIGPTTIDFNKIVNNQYICNRMGKFKITDYIQRGIKKIGIVINTDTYDKGGQHWISLFIDIRKQIIFFFDSVGSHIPPQISAFCNKVVAQGKQIGLSFQVDSNSGTQHQRGGTECGMYSIYFIVHMLEDKHNTHYFKTHIIPDKHVSAFRTKYFNYPNEHYS